MSPLPALVTVSMAPVPGVAPVTLTATYGPAGSDSVEVVLPIVNDWLTAVGRVLIESP